MYPNQIQDTKTLWMGDIEHWMDENFVSQLFQNTGLLTVKVIRDKITGLPAGYGFVEFQTHEMAAHVMNTFNGSPIPGTHKSFRLNWGVFGGGARPGMQQAPGMMQPQQTQMGMMNTQQMTMQMPQQPMGYIGQGPGMGMGQVGMPLQGIIPQQAVVGDYSIYVQDLDPTINEQQLADFFRQRYQSVMGSKIVYDPMTKLGKGYGFVKFGDQGESQRALSEMNGTLFRGRHIKTNSATWKSAQMSNIQYQQTYFYSFVQQPPQQYQQVMMQQTYLPGQPQTQPNVQIIQQKPNPNLQRKVEKTTKPYQREEYTENSVEFILNKIEYETVLKFLE